MTKFSINSPLKQKGNIVLKSLNHMFNENEIDIKIMEFNVCKNLEIEFLTNKDNVISVSYATMQLPIDELVDKIFNQIANE
jgi:hypothetical protein